MAENDNIIDDEENERFNSMLNAAQKQVGAVPGDDGSSGTGLTAGGGKLSQAQIEAMLAINTTAEVGGPAPDADESENSGTDTAASDGEPAMPSEPEIPKDEDQLIAERLREGIAAEMQPAEPAPAAPEEDGKGKKKGKKEKKEKAPKQKKDKKPVDPVLLARIITVAAAVVSLALGFCVCLLMFTDVIKSGEEQFAIRAANAVNSKLKLNTEFYVYKAYVWTRDQSDECMLYALTSYGGEDKMDIYRVVVEHDSPLVNLYYTLDENDPGYIQMKESENSKDRIVASLKKQYSDAIYAADREIQINAPKWVKVNCTVINKNITSVQEG